MAALKENSEISVIWLSRLVWDEETVSSNPTFPTNIKIIRISMSTKLRPLHDRVIVKRMNQVTKTSFGLIIPDAAAEKPDQGEVLAIGPGKRDSEGTFVALNVSIGDRVLFNKHSGQVVKIDGEELLVLKEDELFAIVEQ